MKKISWDEDEKEEEEEEILPKLEDMVFSNGNGVSTPPSPQVSLYAIIFDWALMSEKRKAQYNSRARDPWGRHLQSTSYIPCTGTDAKDSVVN